ncbi:hypothetical protein DFH28DRAFT_1081408 [Melampsora americana]|nr:hypothetical protein DFH28DRAFT_1081408 [Melampsora americana]
MGQQLGRSFNDIRFEKEDTTVPSALVDGGHAIWQTFKPGSDLGKVNIEYPNVRWNYIRSTSGWAGLQHITYLRARLIIKPEGIDQPMYITGNLIEGYEWAICSNSEPHELEWYQGDMYSYSDLMKIEDDNELHPFTQTLALPQSQNGEYTIIVKSVYDIRIRGDPLSIDRLDPAASFRLDLKPWHIVRNQHKLSVYPSSTLVPDVLLDNHQQTRFKLASNQVGLIVRNWDQYNTYRITSVCGRWAGEDNANASYETIGLALNPTNLAPNQISSISLILPDSLTCPKSPLYMEIIMNVIDHAPIRSEINFHTKYTREPFRFTFLDADQSVQYAICLPPSTPASLTPQSQQTCHDGPDLAYPSLRRPLLVALHGAGVEASDQFWISSIVQRTTEWIVFPTGRTSWGWDWHGPSLRNVEHAVSKLVDEVWGIWRSLIHEDGPVFKPDGDDLVVLGHSNGGQGAWYFASRYPDRVRAVIPAAAYVKIQDYVPYISYQTRHLLDPFLGNIVSLAQSIYDNDLHISNLVHMSMLIKHGEIDDNVPIYHSKILYGLLHTWGADRKNVTFEGIPDEKHWFNDVFKSPSVVNFLDKQISMSRADMDLEKGSFEFTLTVSNPIEAGSFHGFKILMLLQAWKIGRIKVMGVRNQSKWALKVETTNVLAFELPVKTLSRRLDGHLSALVDGLEVDLDSNASSRLIMIRSKEDVWNSVEESFWHTFSHKKRQSPLTQILTSTGPMKIIYGTQDQKHGGHLQSVAKPLADASVNYGNLIVIGNTVDNCYFSSHALCQAVEIKWIAGIDNQASFSVADHKFDKPGQGIIYQILHPLISHPKLSSSSHHQKSAIVISGTDQAGIESALRLFPLRTGT